MLPPNIWFGLSLYVASYEIRYSVCSVCTMNEYAVLIVYTLHTKHLISDLAIYKERPYQMFGQNI